PCLLFLVSARCRHRHLPPSPTRRSSDLAAYPQSGTDAIVAGSQLVLALQQIVSRNNDPLNPLVVSVTEFRGGDTWNVLPETVVIDRKSTRLNSSHVSISYAVFCLNK